jgi:hypothetical protein
MIVQEQNPTTCCEEKIKNKKIKKNKKLKK